MFQDNLFQGRVAVVTGAGQGIGRDIAVELASLGADVGVNDLNEESVQETVAAIEEQGQSAIAVPGDVRDTDFVEEMIDEVERELGLVQHVVNNAATTYTTSLIELPAEEWDKTMEVNAGATFRIAREVAKRLIDADESGSIVNVSSIGATMAFPGTGAYSSSKAAIQKLTDQMALEWGEHDIRVNAVSPGLILTEGTKATYEDEDVKAAREDWIPIGRIGTPEDITRGIIFMLSPENTYTTGESLFVDGGAQNVGLNLVPGRSDIGD